MIARNNRNIYSGKKAPSAALTLFGPKVEPKGYIKHSRLLSYSQRVFRVVPGMSRSAISYLSRK